MVKTIVFQINVIVNFYYNVLGVICNQHENYDKEPTKYLFLSNMDHSFMIFFKVNCEQYSTNVDHHDKSNHGRFVHTIYQKLDCLKLTTSTDSSCPSSSTYPGCGSNYPGQGEIFYCSHNHSRSINQVFAEHVDMTDLESTYNYFFHGIDVFSFPPIAEELFVNTIEEISKDMNQFNVKEYACDICGDKGYGF